MAYWDQESSNYFLKKLKYSYFFVSILLSIFISLAIHNKYIQMSGSQRQGDDKGHVIVDLFVNNHYYEVISIRVSIENYSIIYTGLSIAIFLCLLIASLAICYVIYRVCKSVSRKSSCARDAVRL